MDLVQFQFFILEKYVFKKTSGFINLGMLVSLKKLLCI